MRNFEHFLHEDLLFKSMEDIQTIKKPVNNYVWCTNWPKETDLCDTQICFVFALMKR